MSNFCAQELRSCESWEVAQPQLQQNISFSVQDLFNEVKPRAGQKEKVLTSELVSSLGTDIPADGWTDIPDDGELRLSTRNAAPSALASDWNNLESKRSPPPFIDHQ